MMGAFESERKKSARAVVRNQVAQNDRERKDKHLMADMIPIGLTKQQQ
jgi:hypothetical protein